MKELLKTLNEAEVIANKADEAWEAEPENEKLEKAFDEAYRKERIAFENLVNEIVKMTNGKIDKKTASVMIRTKRTELENLINLTA